MYYVYAAEASASDISASQHNGFSNSSPASSLFTNQVNATFTTTATNRSITAATDCSASWADWLHLSISYDYGSWATITSTRIYHNITAKTTKLCDGHTRILGGNNALTTTATGTSIFTTYAIQTRPWLFTEPVPTCLPDAAARTSIWLLYGAWPPNTKAYIESQFPSALPSSLAGHGSICGHCSIYGGTVQLLYFPVTEESTHELCPTSSPGSPTLCPLASTLHSYTVSNPYEFSPCAYVAGNTTSTRNSGPYFISNGHTFYQNRAYISLHTAYAKDMCSSVGTQYGETILELASTDVYSIGGYHHQFKDVGYSVNFADFNTVPAAAYYQACNIEGAAASFCSYTGSRYRYGTDFINGANTIDLGNVYQLGETKNQWIWDEAYAPTLLVPLQMRQLDPAWSTCSYNLNGLYDPPRLLTEALTYATPTYPGSTAPPIASARPGSTPDVGDPSATADPRVTTPVLSDPTRRPSSRALAGPGNGQPPASFPRDPARASHDPFRPSHAHGLHRSHHPDANNHPSDIPYMGSDSTDVTPPQKHNIRTFTVNHHTHTISAVSTASGVYVIDGSSTIDPGHPGATIDGARVSVGSGGDVVVGSTSLTLFTGGEGSPKSEGIPSSSAVNSYQTTKLPKIIEPDDSKETSSSSSTSNSTAQCLLKDSAVINGLLVWLIAWVATFIWL